MSVYSRVRRRQLLQEAEGYLELIELVSEEGDAPLSIRRPMSERALDCLDRLDPHAANRGEALFLRGRALLAMGDYKAAIRPFRTAARHDPKNFSIAISLGWCYKRLGKLDQAIQALEDALDANSNQAILHYNLACYWSLAQNVGLSLSYLSRALQIDPSFRDLVAREADFDPVRSHPEFLALTSVTV